MTVVKLSKKLLGVVFGGTSELYRFLCKRDLTNVIPIQKPDTMWDCSGPESHKQVGDCLAYGACPGRCNCVA